MTPKTPVYWRTKDGRKVVIVLTPKDKTQKIMCYSFMDAAFVYFYDDELTEWREPVTKTVYMQLWDDGCVMILADKHSGYHQKNKLLAQKKITITEGEFDD